MNTLQPSSDYSHCVTRPTVGVDQSVAETLDGLKSLSYDSDLSLADKSALRKAGIHQMISFPRGPEGAVNRQARRRTAHLQSTTRAYRHCHRIDLSRPQTPLQKTSYPSQIRNASYATFSLSPVAKTSAIP